MSDFHHYSLGLYESRQAANEQETLEKAGQIADAALDAICDKMDLRGKDWELMHKLISGHVNDVLYAEVV
tara:strand:+ start:829 stop:1038 length:210 start_codon:yes stop_codon:yes gene_type:complete